MRAKYGPWMVHDKISPLQSSFIKWREICGNARGVMSQIHWVNRGGHIVDFFYDSWISDLLLNRWPTFVSMVIGKGMRILDLMCSERGGWHDDCVAQFFGPDLASRSYPLLSLYMMPKT